MKPGGAVDAGKPKHIAPLPLRNHLGLTLPRDPGHRPAPETPYRPQGRKNESLHRAPALLAGPHDRLVPDRNPLRGGQSSQAARSFEKAWLSPRHDRSSKNRVPGASHIAALNCRYVAATEKCIVCIKPYARARRRGRPDLDQIDTHDLLI
ncbi:MAG: hypothetical protein FJX62_22760 [Alphaproteobacteria bacterium]|nr:hypothetical protein [Alphaproteobacteria bacterium]